MKYIGYPLLIIFFLFSGCGGSGGGSDETVTPSNETLHGKTNGDGLDLVIVSEAFTSSDLGKFHTAADEISNHILTYNDTMKLHTNAWNIHRMDKVSATSELSSATNTAYEAYFNCRNIARMVCIADVDSLFSDVKSAYPQVDHILVLVNSTQYGGSGGLFSVASLGGNYKHVAVHEIAHRFVIFDEYSDPEKTSATLSSDTVFPEDYILNLTAINDIATVKWQHWLDHVDVDMFEGGAGYQYGIWRPTATSIMNSDPVTGTKAPFGPVNLELWSLSVYWYAGTHYGYLPESMDITSTAGEEFTFSIDPSMGLEAQQIDWYVDGELAASNTTTFTCCNYKSNNYTVSVSISDKTGAIRQDKVIVSSQVPDWLRERDNLPADSALLNVKTDVSSSTITWNVTVN